MTGLQSASSLVMRDLVSHVRTFFTGIEEMNTFRGGKALGRKHLSDATVAISRARQLDLELEQRLT